MTMKNFMYVVAAAVFAVAATAAAVVLPEQVARWNDSPTAHQLNEPEILQFREGAARFVVTDIKNGRSGGVTVEIPAPKTVSKQTDQ